MYSIASMNSNVIELRITNTGLAFSPILSNETLDKLDVTVRLLVSCESRIDKCVRQSNLLGVEVFFLSPTVALFPP